MVRRFTKLSAKLIGQGTLVVDLSLEEAANKESEEERLNLKKKSPIRLQALLPELLQKKRGVLESPSVGSGGGNAKEGEGGSSTCRETRAQVCFAEFPRNKMAHPEEGFPLQHQSGSGSGTTVTSMAPKSMTMAARCNRASVVTDGVIFFGGALVALLLVWSCWSFVAPVPSSPNFPPILSSNSASVLRGIDDDGDEPLVLGPTAACSEDEAALRRRELEMPTFYDDPGVTYAVGQGRIGDWDGKRRRWLRDHPWLARGAEERVLLVTGSQPRPCRNPIGDHFLLRFFKNKVDYCRLQGCEVFYNNALLHREMFTFWAKIPVLRAAMVAHPEAEWLWWVDSDAAFTDMDFRLPLRRYRAHNLVVHGWPQLVYESKSWVSLNAGVFLIRNCQWSVDFMDRWAKMGPQSPDYDKWGEIQRATTKDKAFPESDDQSGLVYILLKEKEQWGNKIYLESDYYFEGYWLDIVAGLENATERYEEVERGVAALRRRHAEVVSRAYGELRREYLKGEGYHKGSRRRPFITHFTGCQPCSGDHNKMYSGESCSAGMQRALNFADNQILRNYGFKRRGLLDSDPIEPLPYGYPAA
ncbi:hypothetical protein H6P81_020719 [Aristolochia fimbriata]|uniref:Glycosyltransferase 7 n=1 Tax=Aristolochia fimbriata TaxID=158543 RepID=A0AAV7DVI6_ARIFI|nr:hypothetical protein H6P81_020719 [Aristolochia fimbriata]